MKRLPLSRRFHGAAAGLVLAAASAGAACSDDSSSSAGTTAEPGADALIDAAEATLGEPTMAFDVRIAIDGGVPTPQGGVVGVGDFESGAGEVVSRSAGDEIHAVVDEHGFWFTSNEADFRDAMPSGKTWVRGEFGDLGDEGIVSPIEPPAVLYLVAGAEGARVRSGSGDHVTYEFDIDLDEAVRAAPSSRREEVSDLMWTTDGDVSATGEAVVEDGRVRSLVARGRVTGADDAPAVQIRWDATFDTLGEPIETTRPMEDEVVDLADVPELRDWFEGGYPSD